MSSRKHYYMFTYLVGSSNGFQTCNSFSAINVNLVNIDVIESNRKFAKLKDATIMSISYLGYMLIEEFDPSNSLNLKVEHPDE